MEARCTSCHSPKNYFREDHTWLGWQWVVLRMQWLNDAELKAAERAAIVAYLSTARPAPPTGVMLEWGAPLATGLVFALLFIWRWRSKQRGKRF